MDAATIHRLNQINREFYRITAADFAATRGRAWPGWEALLPYLSPPSMTVLDVGCGNGRFGVFLAQQVTVNPDSPQPSIHYHGLDNNASLLQYAQTALTDLPQIEAQLTEHDIVEQPPTEGTYDRVVLFGVVHHLPGYTQRQAFMRTLAERVAPGGLLTFACWRFYEYERFQARITPWPDDLQVEQHDYLLDWRRGETALRYCHYVDDDEHAALIKATGLSEIHTYRADGATGDANRYSVLRRF
jgi:tRNA (uracil-5-)-methyltransferase TRM9